MSPRTRKILKNVEAKIMPVTVMALLVVAGLITVFVFAPGDVVVHSQPAPYNFAYYKSITLNSSQVPSTLSNFPVLINITDTDLRDNVVNDTGWDIAFFDGTSPDSTQYNHEIELFNSTTGKLVAWVNITSLGHSDDTVLYMHYGDTNVSENYENVVCTWDSNYVLVLHMDGADDTEITDSSGNNNHVTSSGGTPTYQVEGPVGYAVEFNHSNSEYLRIPTSSSLNISGNITMAGWAEYTGHSDGYYALVSKFDTGANERAYWLGGKISPDSFRAYVSDDGTWTAGHISQSDCDMTMVDESIYYAATFDITGNGSIELYPNGNLKVTRYFGMGADNIHLSSADVLIAAVFNSGTPYRFVSGVIDEVRISNIVRSADWIKTEYNSINNATDGGFFTLGTQNDVTVGQYEISGLNHDTRFTWRGEADTSVWANDTGATHETMAIHTNVSSSSENCTDIFLDFGSGIDADITEQHFYVAVKNNADGTWSGNTVQVPNGGNLTINSSQWVNNWCDGTNPFPIIGTDVTILVRVQVAIPEGQAPDTYTTDSWKVTWKVIT